MKKTNKPKACPLCGTQLPYNKWLKVVGVYEEQQKHRKQLELELNEMKKQEALLRKEYKKIRQREKKMQAEYNKKMRTERKRIKSIEANLKVKEQTLKSKLKKQFKAQQMKLREKFEKEKKSAVNRVRKQGIRIGSEKEKAKVKKLRNTIEGIKTKAVEAEAKLKQAFKQREERLLHKLEKQRQRELKRANLEGINVGIAKQKARTTKVSKMAEKYRKARDAAIDKVKQLEEMVKKGTTPQIEGLHFERQLAKQLKSRFSEDDIKSTGHKGDIIQTIKAEGKKVGKIVYECKKTNAFQKKFIQQIRRDKARVVADYGVIVTWATKEEKQGFWVEGDIIVVHPYGVLDVAAFLRETLVQMYTLKLSKTQFETKGRAILKFMQSEEFRSCIQDSITKSKEAYDILSREYKSHVIAWKKRIKIYQSIYKNSNVIQNTVRYVLLHSKLPERLLLTQELPALQILPRNKMQP